MSNEKIEQIPLDSITPSPRNRRYERIDEGDLVGLAESIKAIGVQQPAVVRKTPEGDPRGVAYELVAGERRWRASRVAGMETLPCVIRDLTDAQALHIQLVENLQRKDIHPMDEADGFERLRQEGGYDVEQVAQEVGRSPAYIYQRLRLLELIPAVQKLFLAGSMNAASAIQIARLAAEQQQDVLKGCFDKWSMERGVSARGVGEYIQSHILMELSQAPWKLDDATLTPTAGSCASCPKRTGYAPALFEDIGKKDHCLDRTCFAAKGQALVSRRREEMANTEHLEVTDTYTREELAKDILSPHDWRECKKKDPGAVRVLVVAGNAPGRLTYGQRIASSGRVDSPEASAAEKAAKAQERRKNKAASSVRLAIYEQVRKAFADNLNGAEEVPVVESLRRIEAMAIWGRLEWNSQKFVARFLGWEVPAGYSGHMDKATANKVALMNPRELDLFVFDMCFIPTLQIVNGWSLRMSDKLRSAGEVAGVNFFRLLTDTAAEYEVAVEDIDPPERNYLEAPPTAQEGADSTGIDQFIEEGPK